MRKELELWQFIYERLDRGEDVMLLVVAESSGSSPGREGYKMAVSADGELAGSVGGGVMEVNLVEEARAFLAAPRATAIGLRELVHRENSASASGMICSGRQTIIIKPLTRAETSIIAEALTGLGEDARFLLTITSSTFQIGPAKAGTPNIRFERSHGSEFLYEEAFGYESQLYIIGGGHCSLALSELMSRLDFRISIFDDRSELNTIKKNSFADEISIIDGYEKVGEHIPYVENTYIVVMTLGYAPDKVVIRQLCNRDFRYFGVLGSKAKMATLMKELKGEGISPDLLARIRTPIGIPINSGTPEEIAVSIAAEIIAVKNGAEPTSPRSLKAVRST